MLKEKNAISLDLTYAITNKEVLLVLLSDTKIQDSYF